MVSLPTLARVRLSSAIAFPTNIIAVLPLVLTVRPTKTMSLPTPCALVLFPPYAWVLLVIFRALITFSIF